VSVSEVATGIVLALLATLWMVAARRTSSRRFGVSRAHVRVWARAIGSVPGATLRTGAALVAAIVRPDRARPSAPTRPFRHGATEDPAERGRRATALLAASLAPASYVVRADGGRDEVLFHAIGSAPPPADREWLA
jgi:hypothetical protein